MKPLSLTKRLFLLIVFSYLLLAVPILLLCGNSLENLALERQKDTVKASCSLLCSFIKERFAYQFESNIEQADDYREVCQFFARTVDALIGDVRNPEIERKRLESMRSAFVNEGFRYAFYKKGQGFVYGDDVVSRLFDKGRRDSTWRAMDSLLEKPAGTADGLIGMYILKQPGDMEDKTMLVCVHHLDAVRTFVFATYVRGVNGYNEKTFERAKAEVRNRIEKMSLQSGMTLALLSLDGEVWLSEGAPAEKERLEMLARERAGSGGAIEEIYTYQGEEYYGRAVYLLRYGCVVVASIPMEAVRAPGRNLLVGIAVISFVGLGLGLLAVYYMARGMTKPILSLTAKVGRLAGLDFSGQEGLRTLRQVSSDVPPNPSNEAERLARTFGRMAGELEGSIGKALEDIAVRKRIEGELMAAKNMQMSMLFRPNASFTVGGLDVCTCIRPAREVGGDFYDQIPLKDGRLALVIGDVSGKGVAASLFMAMAIAHVRQALHAGKSLSQAMETVNANLAAGNDTLMFVTLFIGILDVETGRLEYCSGGHCPPAIFCISDSGAEDGSGRVRYLREVGGPLVGVFPKAPYTASETVLAPDECCLLYTDGVIEAMDKKSVLFGEQRLTEALSTAHGTEEAVRSVVDAVGAHSAGAGQTDDITILCIGGCGRKAGTGEGEAPCSR